LIPGTTTPPATAIVPAQFGVKNNLTASASASQLIFDGGFLMGVKASNSFVKLSSLVVQQNDIELEANVKKTYYQYLMVDVNMKSLENSINTLSKTAYDLTETAKAGFIDRIDADRLKLQLSNLTLQKERVADAKAIAYYALKLQLGASLTDSIVLTDALDGFKNEMSQPNQLGNGDYMRRIEMQILTQQQKLNNIDKNRWQYSYLPTIAAFGTIQKNTFGNDFSELGKTWFDGALAGVSMQIPIFDGLGKMAKIQQTKINDKKIENGKNLLQQSIEIERLNAKSKLMRSEQQLKIQEENVKLAKDILDRTTLKMKEGIGSSLELTTAQNDFLNAEAGYLNSLYDLLVAKTDLQKAIGY
jgi:outer membrane protein TolC